MICKSIRSRCVRHRIAAVLPLLALLAVGCGKAETSTADASSKDAAATTSTSGEPKSSKGAREILEQMARAYRDAKTYADGAQVNLTFQQDGQAYEQPQRYMVAFERPNKLRLQINDASVTSDGKQLRAVIDSLPGQVLETTAPEQLRPIDLLADEILAERIEQEPMQLVLLQDPKALEKLGLKLDSAKLLEGDSVEARKCHRVQVENPEGTLVFWIDQEDHTLRRLDLPPDAYKQMLESQGGKIDGVSVAVTFDGAKLGSEIADSTFQIEVPEGARTVKRFVRAVPPNPLSPLLGEKIGDFSLKTPSGDPVTREFLEGKVAVLDFWFTGCQPCQQTMPAISAIYEKYKDNASVVFLAVSVDDSQVTDEKLAETTKAWGSSIPIARLSGEEADKIFQVSAYPTLIVLGKDGSLQYTVSGVNENELPSTLDKLLAGESVVEDVRRQYEQNLQAYEQMIAMGNQGSSTTIQEIPTVEIAERSEPAKIRIEKLWTAEGIEKPGNVLVAGDHVYALDGVRTVVQFDAAGKEVARHELKIPEGAPVFSLRSEVDDSGKRWFVGVADGQQQLFVFDDAWNLSLSYPEADTKPHDGLADAQLADLDGDGKLDLAIGYWGEIGIQGVSLEGKRLWFDRSVQLVLNVAALLPDEMQRRQVISTTSQGALALFAHEGKLDRQISLPYRQMHYLRAADLDSDGRDDLCALSVPMIATSVAVGVGLDGRELWNHELPRGVHETAIDKIVWGPVLAEGEQWLLPSPDGSIHIIDAKGELVDQFNYGKKLTGLAAAEIDGQRTLIVATPDSLEGWRVTTGEARLAATPEIKADGKAEPDSTDDATKPASEDADEEPASDDSAESKPSESNAEETKPAESTPEPLELDFGTDDK